MLIRHEGAPKSAVIWEDAKPIAIPPADLIFLGRVTMAPRRFLRRKPDFSLARYEEITSLLVEGKAVDDEVTYTLFDYQTPPVSFVEFFRARPATPDKPDSVALDKVLTREVLEEAMQNPASAKEFTVSEAPKKMDTSD